MPLLMGDKGMTDFSGFEPDNTYDPKLLAKVVTVRVRSLYENGVVPFILGFATCALGVVMGVAWLGSKVCGLFGVSQ